METQKLPIDRKMLLDIIECTFLSSAFVELHLRGRGCDVTATAKNIVANIIGRFSEGRDTDWNAVGCEFEFISHPACELTFVHVQVFWWNRPEDQKGYRHRGPAPESTYAAHYILEDGVGFVAHHESEVNDKRQKFQQYLDELVARRKQEIAERPAPAETLADIDVAPGEVFQEKRDGLEVRD